MDSALEEWTTDKRKGTYADNKDFQRALSALGVPKIKPSEGQRTKAGRLSAVEAKNNFNSLAAKWREAGRFGRPLLDEADRRPRHRRNAQDWLQKQMQMAAKKRRILMGVSGVGCWFDWQ